MYWPWNARFLNSISCHLLWCLCGNRLTEAPVVPQVIEGGHHVALEVIPAKAELSSDITIFEMAISEIYYSLTIRFRVTVIQKGIYFNPPIQADTSDRRVKATEASWLSRF